MYLFDKTSVEMLHLQVSIKLMERLKQRNLMEKRNLCSGGHSRTTVFAGKQIRQNLDITITQILKQIPAGNPASGVPVSPRRVSGEQESIPCVGNAWRDEANLEVPSDPEIERLTEGRVRGQTSHTIPQFRAVLTERQHDSQFPVSCF